jgi:hypothetical protein
MAAWQFDVQFVRTDLHALGTSENVRSASRLSPSDYEAAKGLLDELGFPRQSFSAGWIIYGDAKGNRVDLVLIDEGGAEISARIDTAGESDLFVNFVCLLGLDLKCQLWSSEQDCVVKPNKEALVTSLMSSDAWKYALDPSSFLKDIRN